MEKEEPLYEPVAVRPATAAHLLECSLPQIYKMVRTGQLKTAKIGHDMRITMASIKARAAA